MLSDNVVCRINTERAVKSARERRVPFVPFNVEEIKHWKRFLFPNLGYYIPNGWESLDAEWFVDKTGWGEEDEPALTVGQFREEILEYVRQNPGHGFAIYEEGQFQLRVRAYRKTEAEGGQ